ncbi:MAG: heavy metal-associated domain-containing protein [Candidatus Woesearchaeota archaeon]
MSKKYLFKIKGMHCNSCAYKIEQEIKDQFNLDNVEVSFSDETLQFTSKKEINKNKLNLIIKNMGYEIYGK